GIPPRMYHLSGRTVIRHPAFQPATALTRGSPRRVRRADPSGTLASQTSTAPLDVTVKLQAISLRAPLSRAIATDMPVHLRHATPRAIPAKLIRALSLAPVKRTRRNARPTTTGVASSRSDHDNRSERTKIAASRDAVARIMRTL